MKVYIKILMCVYLILYADAFSRRLRIIGGKLTDVSKFPYMISIRTYIENKIRCGGAIISTKHILTAAHCFDTFQNDFSDLRVYTGNSSSKRASKPMFKIDKVYIHPKYDCTMLTEYMYRYDIAVVTIKGIIEFNTFQNKIDLPTSHVTVGENAIVTGWGKVFPHIEDTSEQLRRATMTILENEECALTHPFLIADEQLCAYQSIGIGICTGDSGSPLVSNGKIIGIASFGLPCAEGVSDIYIRVFSCIDFIKSIMIS